MYPNTFNPMNNSNMMYPNQPGNINFYEQMDQLERKVSRLERQLERLESRVRRLEGGYPVPLSSGREYNSESNHYMI